METYIKKPLVDSLVDSKELQMLKTAIPYMPDSQQKNWAMAVRFIELIKTTALFDQTKESHHELKACSGETQQERISKMLYELRDFCDEKEKEQIDMILRGMNGF